MKPVLAQRLRAARQAVNPPITQRDVARRMHLSPSAINLWEAGKTEPGARHLVELAEWFQVTVDWLLGVEEKAPSGRQVRVPLWFVPVVTPSSLVKWHWDAVSEVLQTKIAYPERTAAAIRVDSEALSASCPTGAYAVISKGHTAPSGALVLAQFGRASEPVLRKLVREGGDDLLVADDTRFPSYRLATGGRILGRVTEVTVRKVLN
jgi:transcriptional regulator with XRE-family HTH domain